MAFDAPTDFSYNPGVDLVPLTEAAADEIAKTGVVERDFAIGRRIFELEQKKASTALLSGSVAGNVAYATISLSVLPLTGSTYTIGADTYQLKAAAASVTNDNYVAVQTDADKDVVGARLADAINAKNARNAHRTIFKVNGTTPARANGSANVRAAYVASTDTLWIFAAEGPGGRLVQGTAPSVALAASATGAPSWSVANLNVSPGAGDQYMTVWRKRHVVSAGDVSAGTIKFAVPFHNATYYGRVTAYTAANERKGTVKAVTDTLSLAAGAITGQGVATLTLPGGGGDLANTDVVYLEIWAPVGETISVPVNEANALNGQIDQIKARTDALEASKFALYTFTGAGDQLSLTTTNKTTFVKKATTLANKVALGAWIEYEAEVFVDGTNGTPQFTVAMEWGTAVLESVAIGTAAANDYVVIRGRLQVTGATTARHYKGLGETKDNALSLHTHAAPADLTIQALTANRDVTVSVTSDAAHASNLVTIKGIRFEVRNP